MELAAHGVSTTTAYFSLIDTDMIKHGVDDDPLVEELLAALPRPLLKRLQPNIAASALADGIASVPHAHGAARWQPMSALRGLIALAMDAHLTRNRAPGRIAQLDARTNTHHDTQNPIPSRGI